MNILDATAEQQAAIDNIDWEERKNLAYPEDALAKQFEAARAKVKTEMPKAERESIVRHYKEWKRKRLTCKKFRVSMIDLEKIIKEEGLV